LIKHKKLNSRTELDSVSHKINNITNEIYIKRCLQIAKNGIGTTRPNPSVGAVLVVDNKIIGEGFTSNYGGNHAEVNAINSVKNKADLQKATLYVTLEPCSHFGKTSPCSDLIIANNIKKVVIGCVDSNELVAGKGIEKLQKAGVNVIVGVLENECLEHHKRFFVYQNKKRPFIILKWAETADGFIYPELVSGSVDNNSKLVELVSGSVDDTSESKNERKTLKQVHGKPIFISNQFSQQLVHKWRSEEHAILVGTTTAIVDNPKLNVRSWGGNSPVRIVIDRNLRIDKNSNLFDGTVKTIVVTESRTKSQESRPNLHFEPINFNENIASQICEVLYNHKFQSVIIEGGTKTLQTFIDANLWDEARIFSSDVEFGVGVKLPIFIGKLKEQISIKNDQLKIYTND